MEEKRYVCVCVCVCVCVYIYTYTCYFRKVKNKLKAKVNRK